MARSKQRFSRNTLWVIAILSVPAWANFNYDEAVSGDLSDSGTAPTIIIPGPGDNYLTGRVGDWGADDDFVGFAIPETLRLDALILVYHSSTTNPSYLGIEDDAVFATGAGNPYYFGYCYFDASEIGIDLLPILGASNGNFEPPLEAGDYTFWIDEGGDWEEYSFQFVFRAYGDLNCDNVINAFDIDPFVLALTDPAGYEAAYPECSADLADANHDGTVNAFDIDPFVALLTGGG
jgi:hypothetical protein